MVKQAASDKGLDNEGGIETRSHPLLVACQAFACRVRVAAVLQLSRGTSWQGREHDHPGPKANKSLKRPQCFTDPVQWPYSR